MLYNNTNTPTTTHHTPDSPPSPLTPRSTTKAASSRHQIPWSTFLSPLPLVTPSTIILFCVPCSSLVSGSPYRCRFPIPCRHTEYPDWVIDCPDDHHHAMREVRHPPGDKKAVRYKCGVRTVFSYLSWSRACYPFTLREWGTYHPLLYNMPRDKLPIFTAMYGILYWCYFAVVATVAAKHPVNTAINIIIEGRAAGRDKFQSRLHSRTCLTTSRALVM